MTESPSATRLAVVTGASEGLGATIAGFLAAEGFDLVLDARRARPLLDTARSIMHWGTRVTTIRGDVTNRQHRLEIARAVSRSGRLDLLVHNASDLGVSPLAPLLRYPLPAFRKVLETNLVAPLALTRLVRKSLARAKGSVIMISSDAAQGGYPGWGAYGASKAGLDLAAKTLATELKPDGIAVLAVDPGDMRTSMHQRAFAGEDISDRPLPDATVPFWAWLLAQPPSTVTGQRFRAQAESWEVLPA